jgi:hypothetical protein
MASGDGGQLAGQRRKRGGRGSTPAGVYLPLPRRSEPITQRVYPGRDPLYPAGPGRPHTRAESPAFASKQRPPSPHNSERDDGTLNPQHRRPSHALPGHVAAYERGLTDRLGSHVRPATPRRLCTTGRTADTPDRQHDHLWRKPKSGEAGSRRRHLSRTTHQPSLPACDDPPMQQCPLGSPRDPQVRDLAVAVTAPLGLSEPKIASVVADAMAWMAEDFGFAGVD